MTIEEFRNQIDIIEAADWLGLAPARSGGGRGKILCPVHDERTPSCELYPDDGHYYCFSCQTSGDVIALVQAVRGASFGESLDWLSERSGIERPSRDPESAARASSLRRLRLALAEGRSLVAVDDRPYLIEDELADRIGLGRGDGLADTQSELARPVISRDEAIAWEGSWTIELYGRGGLVGFGAFLPNQAATTEEEFDPDEEANAQSQSDANVEAPVELGHFVRAAAVRGAVLAGKAAAGDIMRREQTALVSTDPGDWLRLQAAGYGGVISTVGPINADIAALLIGLAPRVVLLTSADQRRDSSFWPGVLHLLRAGARVEISPLADGQPGTPVSLLSYVAAVAERTTPTRRAQMTESFLEAIPSRSTRTMYEAHLTARGLLD